MAIFEGSGVAIVTPFKNGGIDFETFGKLLDFQIQNGTKAIIVCGTTGEPCTMTDEEHIETIKFAIQHVKKRVPVIASTGSNNTAKVIKLSKEAQALGADGLMAVTPYYNKTTQAGLVAHYTAIADAVELPIIIYNVPSRTGLNILPETLSKLSYHPNIAAVKESSGNMEQVADIVRLCGDRLDVYSGDDSLIVPIIALGGKGVISVAANIIPKQVAELCEAAIKSDFALARKLQFEMDPLTDKLFCEVNPIPVKTAMGLMGMIEPFLRLPLYEMGEANKKALADAMRAYGLKV